MDSCDRLELGRIDYLILSTLKENNATSSMLGVTIKELEVSEVKRSCLCKHMILLTNKKYICQSGKYGKQNMYYITELGLKILGGQING